MKHRERIRAGQLVYDTIYTVANAQQGESIRKKQISTRAIARTNCNTAMRTMELLLADNFALLDIVVKLTYDEKFDLGFWGASRGFITVIIKV